jgi:curved DNA-binding protein CbpA
MDNYYDTLEISQKASEEVIKMAYKALAKKFHPDVFQGDKVFSDKKIKEINRAYEILSDPTKKRNYDLTIGNSPYSKAKSNNQSSQYSYSGNANNQSTQNKSSDYRVAIYNNAVRLKANAHSANEFIKAAEMFDTILGYKNANILAAECKELARREKNKEELARREKIYNEAMKVKNTARTESNYIDAYNLFLKIQGYKDADTMAEECKKNSRKEAALKEEIYRRALNEKNVAKSVDDYNETINLFNMIKGYKNSDILIEECIRLKNSAYQKHNASSFSNSNNVQTSIIKQKIKSIATVAIVILLFGMGIYALSVNKNIDTELNGAGRNTSSGYESQNAISENGYLYSSSEQKTTVTIAISSTYIKPTTTIAPTISLRPTPTVSTKVPPTNVSTKSPTPNVSAKSPTPTISAVLYKIGDKLFYGTYEQDNITSNGKEAVEWRILDIENGKALLISEKSLDCKPYNANDNSVTWSSSTLRTWLNNDFMNVVFSEIEKSFILVTDLTNNNNEEYGTNGGINTQDKIFLLSIDEANKYFISSEDRVSKNTAYAKAQGAFDYTSIGWWWLRSPGFVDYYAARVLGGGDIRSCPANTYNNGVRPALWLNLPS